MKGFIAIIIIAFCAINVARGAFNGSASTTRYWDCCKPSCAWKENNGNLNSVSSCSKDGVTKVNDSVQSGCASDGSAFTCNNLQPWAVNDTFAYGFVTASFTANLSSTQCCSCFKLSFIEDLVGKTMIVQNVNSTSGATFNEFNIQIPGGGVGVYTLGCSSQWGTPTKGWGAQYGGVSDDSDCSSLPKVLQAGCQFRFGWFENANNPGATFEEVACPEKLTSLSGCISSTAVSFKKQSTTLLVFYVLAMYVFRTKLTTTYA